MRILAFEVRPDERPSFQRERVRQDVSLDLRDDALCPDNVSACLGYDAVLICGRSACDATLLCQLADMGVHVLVTRTVGMDHIDLDAAGRLGIHVTNVSYSPDSVADFTIMLMLVALRRYKPAVYRQNVNDYSLAGLMGRTLSSMTVGVVGTGHIGQAVIRRLVGFGPRILAFDSREVDAVRDVATYVDRDMLFSDSDLITFHVPSLPSTHHMVNAQSLAAMRDGVVLVNTARGDLMDPAALASGMETGRIGALAMDVFEEESGIYHESHVNDILTNRDMAYLRQFPNSVLTQHMAFYTQQSVDQMVAGGIANAIAGAGERSA
jgi:D-lactate dehydrogenase